MIIVDTNMLIELNRIDVFGQLKDFTEFGEIAILSSSLGELEKLKTKESLFAAQVVHRLKEFDPKLQIIQNFDRDVDKAILKLTRPGKDAVATNDRKLIKELKLNNVKVIRLRQKKYLEIA